LPTGPDHAAHRIDNAAIAGAPAEVAGKLNPDTALVSIRNPLGDIACGDQHAGRAETALQRVLTRKGFTQVCHGRVIVKSFDRPDGKTVAGDRVSDA